MAVPMHNNSRRYIKGSSGEDIFTYVSYGNFRFPAAVSLSFNVEPVYDSSGRVPKWYTHTFTVETVIDPTTLPMDDSGGLYPVDLNMSQVRRWLSIPGQRLAFWNLGIGQNQRLNTSAYQSHPTGVGSVAEPDGSSEGYTIKQDPIVNDSSSSHYSFIVDNNTDLNFGPKPKLLACECIGGSRAFRIVWTVECALPICCLTYTQGNGFTLCYSPDHFNSSYKNVFTSVLENDLKVTEFNYSLSWEVDENRFTRFTIVGSVEFSGLLINIGDNVNDNGTNQTLFNGAVLDTGKVINALAACFWLRAGFNRSIQWDVSRDKRRLDFRITDKEIPSDQPYYPGIKDCDVRQTIQGSPLTPEWTMNFSANYELQPGVPKFWGLVAFINLLHDRLRNLKLGGTEVKDKKGRIRVEKPWIFPTNFSFTDDIYSRKVSFDFSFKLLCEFRQLFLMTRMFSNVYGSWATHRQSLSAETLDLKGTAQIRTLSHEPLVTACRQPDIFKDVTTPPWVKPTVLQQFSLLKPTCPPKEKSIIYFNFTPSIENSNETVDMCPVSWSSTLATTQNFGQIDNAENPQDLSIDPESKNKSYLDALLPGSRAWIKEATTGSANATNSLTIATALEELGINKDLKFRSDMPLVQRTSVPVQYYTITGGMASVCWEQKPPAVKSIKVYDGNGQEKDVTPIIEKELFDGPFQKNIGSQIPIFLYRFRYVFKIVGGSIAGGMLININGEDVTWDTSKRFLRSMYKELNGFKLGDFEDWVNNGIPSEPHVP